MEWFPWVDEEKEGGCAGGWDERIAEEELTQMVEPAVQPAGQLLNRT
jgi:hypothetical protein